jgi:hypothetical protein
MKKLILFVLLLPFTFVVNAQPEPQLDLLFRNSYTVFELQRLPNGMYRDSKLANGTDYHPISIANTGMGLIALCIADSMGWINNAEQLVVETLQSLTGHTPGFTPDRTTNGYYRHFMDISTGDQAWNSEYSTIDTDILVCGALFSMKYFKNSTITEYAMELWNSINFEAAIENASTGHIFLTMNQDGSGIPNALTSKYNEYMIVAWLAKNQSMDLNSLGNTFWNNHYETTSGLPTVNYNGHDVLSDNGFSFLSSFTHQFNYYLCHHFTTSTEYLTFFENAQKADASWWTSTGSNSFEWGLGAGSAVSSAYHADAINNNVDTIVSPHIIAGFIPVNPNGKTDLLNLWNNNLGKYQLPTGNADTILWRYSKTNPTWTPNEFIGVDHATMLFGLATLPEYLGDNFFSTNNDFFPFSTVNTVEINPSFSFIAYPNPARDYITIQLDKNYQQVKLQISNLIGEVVFEKNFNSTELIKIPLQLEEGVYFVRVDNFKVFNTIKILLNK